ncbi:MAG: DNA-protecting protein DprA, partial [Gemmatimonadetes bacterium]|nr:DNA-protecting protein DprA [Gemmatimonadota bacterium]
MKRETPDAPTTLGEAHAIRDRAIAPDREVNSGSLAPQLVLRCTRGLGTVGAARLIAEQGSAEEAVQSLPAAEREEAEARARWVVAQCRERALTALYLGEAGYPASLEALEGPPLVVFVRGDTRLLHTPSVAVVGTRGATTYGLRATDRIATGLARAGVTVVSGLARGVDAAAHEAALRDASPTVAVLGTGADVCYPRENLSLYRVMCAAGAVISEALPGTRAVPGAFPRRNRIVAALADVTLVVEAGVKSGALITAQHAVAIGRPIAAIPGPIDVESFAGSNALLRDGAHVVTGVPDLLALLDLTVRGRS